MFCEHNRIAEQCEDCRFLAALERGEPDAVRQAAGVAGGKVERAPRNTGTRTREVVEVDTHILRTDLDADLGTKGSYVLLKAGDEIPADLADFPRRPAAGAATGKAK